MTGPEHHSAPRNAALSFNEFRLHVEPAALYRHGQPIRLQGQPLRLLRLLASRRGELVTHKEIRQYLWQGHVVDFSAGIQVCINQIRKALDDDAAAPRYIETVARHGYRFVADVQTGDASAEGKPNGNGARAMPANEIEPPVVREPTPQLQSASHPRHRLFPPADPSTFRRAPYLLIPAAVVIAVVSLHQVGERTAAPADRNIDTNLVQASELYERARYLSSYEQKDRSVLALALLQQALRLDPRHGPSHALLADLHATFGEAYFGAASGKDGALVDKHLALAERFGANRSDVLATRGRVALYRDRQISVAQDLLDRAIAADETNVRAWRLKSQTLYLRGRFDEAIVANQRAADLSIDPNGVLWDRLLIYYLAERYADMLALHDRLKSLQRTGSVTVGIGMLLVGREEEGFDFIVDALRSRGNVIADETSALGLIRQGRVAGAYRWLLSEIERNETPLVGARTLAILEIKSGDFERAANRLQAYVEEFRRKATGTSVDCLCVLTLALDPFFRQSSIPRQVRIAIDGTHAEQIEVAAGSAALAEGHGSRRGFPTRIPAP